VARKTGQYASGKLTQASVLTYSKGMVTRSAQWLHLREATTSQAVPKIAQSGFGIQRLANVGTSSVVTEIGLSLCVL